MNVTLIAVKQFTPQAYVFYALSAHFVNHCKKEHIIQCFIPCAWPALSHRSAGQC